TATVWYGTRAADHASGLVMLARVSAAAIFACWLISRVLVGAAPPASLMICGEGSGSVKASGTGSRGESPGGENGRTCTPGFSVSVPAMKSESWGLTDRSSMRRRRVGTI